MLPILFLFNLGLSPEDCNELSKDPDTKFIVEDKGDGNQRHQVSFLFCPDLKWLFKVHTEFQKLSFSTTKVKIL